MRINFKRIFIVLISFCLAFSGCTGTQIAPPTSTATLVPTVTPTLISTPIPLPSLTLVPGDYYFSIDGTQHFIFSRNLAGITPDDYIKLLDLAQKGGTLLVRVGTENSSMGGSYGYGYTATGEIRKDWNNNWESFFDIAESKGIYVLPFFTGWVNWNTVGYNTWDKNPFNSINGGPAKDPTEIFKKDSPIQQLYLDWFRQVVTRWQRHKNIIAWEVVTEVNNINNITEPEGVYLFERLANVARETDPLHRPISASLADIGEWPQFYSSKQLDILDYHPYPYSAELDLGNKLLVDTTRMRASYNKPIIIGESGLNALPPDDEMGSGKLSNASIGIEHAIWSEIVSGTMNGRALFWEDSYGLYFTSLGWPYLEKYAEIELPAAKFVQDVDFTGFKPLKEKASGEVTGGAIGNESTVLGWFRDAKSKPPDWTVQTIPAGQTVAITIPCSAANWKIDFYDTKTGTDIVSSSTVNRKGDKVTITLPDFTDDIAFKMMAQSGTAVPPAGSPLNTDAIAGTWSGTISSSDGTFSTRLELSIQPTCAIGNVCGTFSAPQLPCSGDLSLQEITGDTFIFIEQNATGASFCVSGGTAVLQPLPDGTLSYTYSFTPGSTDTSSGILRRP